MKIVNIITPLLSKLLRGSVDARQSYPKLQLERAVRMDSGQMFVITRELNSEKEYPQYYAIYAGYPFSMKKYDVFHYLALRDGGTIRAYGEKDGEKLAVNVPTFIYGEPATVNDQPVRDLSSKYINSTWRRRTLGIKGLV